MNWCMVHIPQTQKKHINWCAQESARNWFKNGLKNPKCRGLAHSPYLVNYKYQPAASLADTISRPWPGTLWTWVGWGVRRGGAPQNKTIWRTQQKSPSSLYPIPKFSNKETHTSLHGRQEKDIRGWWWQEHPVFLMAHFSKESGRQRCYSNCQLLKLWAKLYKGG